MAATFTICDVAPRDGLQNEDVILAPAERAELCRMLAAARLPRVEVASFVHPKLVPAMAGAEEVVAALPADVETEWSGLILNERGFDRLLASGLRRANYTIAVTETFCQRNQGSSRADAEAAGTAIARRAAAEGIELTVTLAVSFGCPFEGAVPSADTLALAEIVAGWEPGEIVFADTIGVAVPAGVQAVLEPARSLPARIGAHFHDTRNTGIANSYAALELGIDLLDSSAGGTGGCPFAPGATGNVGTEDLLYLLERSGIETGIDFERLLEVSRWLAERLGRRLPASVREVPAAVS